MFATVDKKLQNFNRLPVKYSELNPYERARVRNLYMEKQDNRCMYCNSRFTELPGDKSRGKEIHPELFPEGFFDYTVHLHHDHKTDMTIGAVHCYCNAVLWEYEGK